MRDCSQALAPAGTWLSINDEIRGLLVEVNMTFAGKIPCREDSRDLRRQRMRDRVWDSRLDRLFPLAALAVLLQRSFAVLQLLAPSEHFDEFLDNCPLL